MPIKIIFSAAQAWQELFTRLDSMRAQLDRIEQKGEGLMALIDDLEAKLTEAETAGAATKVLVEEIISLLHAQHDELVALIAGGGASPARLQLIVDRVEAARASFEAQSAALQAAADANPDPGVVTPPVP